MRLKRLDYVLDQQNFHGNLLVLGLQINDIAYEVSQTNIIPRKALACDIINRCHYLARLYSLLATVGVPKFIYLS
jgi:hypothetical protein